MGKILNCNLEDKTCRKWAEGLQNSDSEKNGPGSEEDNDAYCVCTHDFSLCTHKNSDLRVPCTQYTMYAVKISGRRTAFG